MLLRLIEEWGDKYNKINTAQAADGEVPGGKERAQHGPHHSPPLRSLFHLPPAAATRLTTLQGRIGREEGWVLTAGQPREGG